MVGGYALRYALDHPAIERVTAIGRRKLGISHPKLKEVLHQDFADCSALAAPLGARTQRSFASAHIPVWCRTAELRKVTVDYTIEFARVLHTASPAAAFSFLSGSGADPTGRSRMAFARYKGEAEKHFAPRDSHAFTYSGQPTSIQWSRAKNRISAIALLRSIYPVFRMLFPNQVIRADDLAQAMVDIAVRGNRKPGGHILENRDIRARVETLHRTR